MSVVSQIEILKAKVLAVLSARAGYKKFTETNDKKFVEDGGKRIWFPFKDSLPGRISNIRESSENLSQNDQNSRRKSAKEAEKYAKEIAEGAEVTGDMIANLLTNPVFRKSVGLEAGGATVKLIDVAAKRIAKDSGVQKFIAGLSDEIEDELIQRYGDGGGASAQSIRKTDNLKPKKGATLAEQMEFNIARYKAYEKALEAPEDYSQLADYTGRAIKATIPVAIGVAIGMDPEVLLPMLSSGTINWGEVFASPAFGQAVDIGIKKGLEKAKIDNLGIEIGASVVAGLLSGALMSKAISRFTAIEARDAEMKEIAEGAEVTEDMIANLLRNPVFRKSVGLEAGGTVLKLADIAGKRIAKDSDAQQLIAEMSAEIETELRETYGDDGSALDQALRKTDKLKPKKGASFAEEMEFNIARYKAYEKALESPESYSKLGDYTGRAMKSVIPVAIGVAIGMDPEVLLPMLSSGTINWGTVFASPAFGQAVDMGVQNGLEKAKIDNIGVSIVASVIAGALSGALVSKAASRFAAIESKRPD